MMDEPFINSPDEEDESEELVHAVSSTENANAHIQNAARFNEASIDPALGSAGMHTESLELRRTPDGAQNPLDGTDDRHFYTEMARSATSLFAETGEQSSQTTGPELAGPFGTVHIHERKWPDKNVTEETLDDAYVNFIFSCNPSVSLSCDSMELRRAFRMPPKSDGNTFSTFKLLKLIEKFEDGEIKTWTKLATDLGVERKDDQSTQKVQQYAVRLKRWMHAMHIDAFFEYCLGKPHVYYAKIPKEVGTPSETVRDGVPLEEDLALRALLPESRPKRGRRKLDDRGEGTPTDDEQRPSKRSNLGSTTPNYTDDSTRYDSNPILFQQTPQSALSSTLDHELGRYLEPVTPEQWSAATAAAISATLMSAPASASPNTTSAGSQTFRWRAFQEKTSGLRASPQHMFEQEEAETPVTPSTTASPSSAKSRSRRRHGPAVSSAWPSAGNQGTGKLRGRPPSNRTVQDGPYSTFPANPLGKPGPVVDLIRQNNDLMRQNDPSRHNDNGSAGTPSSTPIVGTQNQFTVKEGRPKALHVQVPLRHSTFPISLKEQSATMSPQVRMSEIIERIPYAPRKILDALDFADMSARAKVRDDNKPFDEIEHDPAVPHIYTLVEIERDFTSQLLFSTGEETNITSGKARSIAAAVVAGFRKNRALKDDGNALAKVAAVCLGKSSGMHVTDLTVMSEITRPAILSRHTDPGSQHAEHDINPEENASSAFSEQLLETYTVSWKIAIGATNAAYSTKVTIPCFPGLAHSEVMSLHDEVDELFHGMQDGAELGTTADRMHEGEHDAGKISDNDPSWKDKCLLLEDQLRKTKADMENLKKGIIQSVMGSA